MKPGYQATAYVSECEVYLEKKHTLTPVKRPHFMCEVGALLSLGQLIGDPGVTVFQIDDAAAVETVFIQQVLHDLIIEMGVDPKV